jgi:hypothetical protein
MTGQQASKVIMFITHEADHVSVTTLQLPMPSAVMTCGPFHCLSCSTSSMKTAVSLLQTKNVKHYITNRPLARDDGSG